MAAKRGRGGKMIRKGHRKRVWAVALSPNGALLATVDEGGVLCVGPPWQAQPDQVVQAHTSHAMGVCWLDDETVATSGIHEIRLWSARTGAMRDEVAYPEGWPIHDMIALGGSVVLSAQLKHGWIWTPGSALEPLETNHSARLAAGPDGALVHAVDHTDVVGRAPSGEELWRIHTGGYVHSVAVDARGARVAIGTSDASSNTLLQLHSIPDGALLTAQTGFTTQLGVVAFSPDATLLAMAPISGHVRLVRADDGQDLFERIGELPVAMDMAMTNDTLVIAESMTNKARLFDLDRFLG